MGIFTRMRSIVKSNVNSILDKKENPVKLTDQYIRDMEEHIQEVEYAVAQQIAVKNRLRQKLDEVESLVSKREEQAKMAVEIGNIDLARRSLEDKKIHQATLDDLKSQYSTAKSTAKRMKEQLFTMSDELTKMKNKRDTIVSRYEAAKAQKKINETMSSFNIDGAKEGFDRMNQKMLKLEAEVQAGVELRNIVSNDLDKEFNNLKKGDSVEEELKALMQKHSKA